MSTQASNSTEEYEECTQVEHVLKRPDMYVGSTEPHTIPETFILENGNFTKSSVTIVPALIKIVDEILVNAADNKARNPDMDYIKVNVDPSTCQITVQNNGKCIPIRKHETKDIYIPEMIFGRLLTGSNFKDDQKRIYGGRFGVGAKATNIYSTEFSIEICDSERKLMYKQTWSENMSKVSKPKVTKCSKKDYITISFTPDLARFQMPSFTEDTIKVFTKRVYDIAGTLNGVKIHLNNEKVKINSFKDYVSLYLKNEDEHKPKIVYEKINDRWDVAVTLSDLGSFQHVSFVNNISTTKGGTHVAHVTDQIVTKLLECVRKKFKGDSKSVKPAHIKNQLFVFVNCLVENPTFDSQTKEFMNLKPDAFGSVCNITDEFIKKILKLGIVESTLELLKEKEATQLTKTDGKKRQNLLGISTLDDAIKSGTKDSKKCTLFLTEGLSAKSFAIAGLSAVPEGRHIYGAFPLRGKLLNVRDASSSQIANNVETTQLKQILGLQEKKYYNSIDELRYGRICLLTDADLDGHHIKGLLMNWLERGWPSLLKIPGFLCEFVTPVLVCKKRNVEKKFYNMQEFKEWKESLEDGISGWQIKYYKGLGTNEDSEAKQYFTDIDSHLKNFRKLDSTDIEKLDLVFNKKRSSDRKEWLKTYDENVYIDSFVKEYSVSDFIDKTLIQFSMYDNIRSIPNVVDGLKPGQRKILYTMFKKNITKNIKVAQLAAEVARITEYRHGEQSLCETIVGMAQNFVGSNNLNLLYPAGQFGKRLQGGKDAASPRYIFTHLESITRLIFRPEDDNILEYQEEDGELIEPHMYLPVIPMILVNGAEGIGSGYSTSIPPHNPLHLIQYLEGRLSSVQSIKEILPWYKGFTGSLIKDEGKIYLSGTVTQQKKNTWTVTELPVGVWTDVYKEFLEKLIVEGTLKSFENQSSDKNIHFKVESVENHTEEEMRKILKLVTQKSLLNMVSFNTHNNLHRYTDAKELLSEFYTFRLQYYHKRKEYVLKEVQKQILVAQSKLRFVSDIHTKQIIVYDKTKKELKDSMIQKGYYQNTITENEKDEFDYLLRMPLYTLTTERHKLLKKELIELEQKYEFTKQKTPEQLWLQDLSDLKKELSKMGSF